MSPMSPMRQYLSAANYWQQRNPIFGRAYAVIKKFGDDQTNLYVTSIGWYGFVAIYPLLLVVITIFGYVGAASLGKSVVRTLHEFPVIGQQFNPSGTSSLHGNVFALVIGVIGLIYGAQGVTQNAQMAMAQVWNIPQVERPNFVRSLGRSVVGLVAIAATFALNAVGGTYATGTGKSVGLRVGVIAAMLVMNILLYAVTFRALTAKSVRTRWLFPGAVLAATAFTLLITVGTGLLAHQVRHSSATYGQFGVVIGLVGVLFLLAKFSLYGAELNVVLARQLWPRSLVADEPTLGDDTVLRHLALQEQRRRDESIEVAFAGTSNVPATPRHTRPDVPAGSA